MGFFLIDPRCRHRRRSVPASLPGVDCDRLRPQRHQRRPERRRRIGDARPAGGLLRRRAAARAGPGVLRVASAGAVGRGRLVRPLSEFRDGPAGPAVCRAARLLAFAHRRRPVLRAGGGRRARPAGLHAVRRDPGLGRQWARPSSCCCSGAGGRGCRSSCPSRSRRPPWPPTSGWSCAPASAATWCSSRTCARFTWRSSAWRRSARSRSWRSRGTGGLAAPGHDLDAADRGRRHRRARRCTPTSSACRRDGSRRTTRCRSGRSRGTSRGPAWWRRSPASCCWRGSGSGAIRRCCS